MRNTGLQAIVFRLNLILVCIWDDLANSKNGFNLVLNSVKPTLYRF